jgi:hypothetical protein
MNWTQYVGDSTPERRLTAIERDAIADQAGVFAVERAELHRRAVHSTPAENSRTMTNSIDVRWVQRTPLLAWTINAP